VTRGRGRPRKDKRPMDTSQKRCECAGRLVEVDEDGEVQCSKCGRPKAERARHE
jgi:hypothetical protein